MHLSTRACVCIILACVAFATAQDATTPEPQQVDPSGRDECKEAPAKDVCYNAGQNCVDRNFNVDNDWICFCPEPSVGYRDGAVANCILPSGQCTDGCGQCETDEETGVCEAKYVLSGGRDNFVLQFKPPTTG